MRTLRNLLLPLLLTIPLQGQDAVHRYFDDLRAFDFDATVLIAEKGKVILRASTRPTTTTPYYIASVTKTFTSVAILSLVRDGQLALTDPLTRFFADVPDEKKPISIEQLLTHTSGIGHLYAADEAKTRDEAVRSVLAAPLVNTPGAKRSYSSDGYVLLAAIVEIASKEPFDQYVRREVFQPAGLQRIAFAGSCSGAVARIVARGFDGSPCARPPNLAQRGPTGIIADVDDLFSWIDAAARRQLFGGELPGWEVRGPYLGHEGSDDVIGHTTVALHDRERDRTVIAASSSGEYSRQSLAWVVAQHVLSLLDAPAIVRRNVTRDEQGREWMTVEGQPEIDRLLGNTSTAERSNTAVARMLQTLRDGGEVELKPMNGFWQRLKPHDATVIGTGPVWWDPAGGTATFIRFEHEKGSSIGRVEWDSNGAVRAFGGAAIPAPMVFAVRGGEAFDPVSGTRVRVTP